MWFDDNKTINTPITEANPKCVYLH
jgi:hypothetical protein